MNLIATADSHTKSLNLIFLVVFDSPPMRYLSGAAHLFNARALRIPLDNLDNRMKRSPCFETVSSASEVRFLSSILSISEFRPSRLDPVVGDCVPPRMKFLIFKVNSTTISFGNLGLVSAVCKRTQLFCTDTYLSTLVLTFQRSSPKSFLFSFSPKSLTSAACTINTPDFALKC